jgi:hypothetical protein
MQTAYQFGWERLVPDYGLYPRNFAVETVPRLAASLIYHHKNGDLANIYPESHPIFRQPIFTDLEVYNALKDQTILTFANCTDCGMYCTGVPGVISTAREIRMFKEDYENTRQILRDNIISMEENILKGLLTVL